MLKTSGATLNPKNKTGWDGTEWDGKYPDSFFELLDEFVLFGVKRRRALKRLHMNLEKRAKVRGHVGGGRVVGGSQSVEGFAGGAEGVRGGDEIERGRLQLQHGGWVIVLLQVLSDQLGSEEGGVAVGQQGLGLGGQGAHGRAQALHGRRRHGDAQRRRARRAGAK